MLEVCSMLLAELVLILVSLAVPAASTPAAIEPAHPRPFVLAILRRDGLISPFAAYDGKAWTAPWPMDLHSLELPLWVDAIPRQWWGKAGMPAAMTIWTDGTQRGTLELTTPTTVRIMCSPRLALSSTYRSPEPAPPSGVQPYPKDGLVISNGQPIDPIEILSPTSPDWMPMAVSLVEPFDAAERETIRGFMEWKHPFTRAQRLQRPIELETLYRAPMDAPGWSAYHVEAVKRYPPGPEDDDCGLVTYLSGWVMAGPDGRRQRQLGAQITYCDRRANTYMLPLGLLTSAGRTSWVYQMSGWGREGYAVVRPTPKRIEPEVQYTAGSCPR